MWTKSLHGMESRPFGSRLLWLCLLAFLLFSPSLLWPEDQTQSQAPQMMLSTPYSKMTRDELMKQIADKDQLISDWIAWSEKEKALKKDQEQVWADRLAARDKMIVDQGYVIDARTKERDQYKAALEGQKAADWFEKLFWGLGGAGLGYAAGHFTK